MNIGPAQNFLWTVLAAIFQVCRQKQNFHIFQCKADFLVPAHRFPCSAIYIFTFDLFQQFKSAIFKDGVSEEQFPYT